MPVTKEISTCVPMSKELLCGLRRGQQDSAQAASRAMAKAGGWDGKDKTQRELKKRGSRITAERLMPKSALPFFHPTCTYAFVRVRRFGLICILSRANTETDNVIYLLSSCLFDKIRRSMLLRLHKCLRACMYVCAQKISRVLCF